MLIESAIVDSLFDDDKTEGFSDSGGGAKSVLWGLLGLVLMIIAGYLAWTCNATQGDVLRIVYTILAVLFSGIYLLFYLIYHVILNVKC